MFFFIGVPPFNFPRKRKRHMHLHMPYHDFHADADCPTLEKQGTVGPFWDPLSLEHRLPRDLVFVIYILSVAPGSSPFRRIPQTDGSIAHSKRKRKAFSLCHMIDSVLQRRSSWFQPFIAFGKKKRIARIFCMCYHMRGNEVLPRRMPELLIKLMTSVSMVCLQRSSAFSDFFRRKAMV